MKFYWTIGFILSTIMLSLPASASWRCPALYDAYYPTVARCPNWVWDSNGPAEQAVDNARRRAEAARAAQAQEEAAQAESARLKSQRKAALAIAQTNAETSQDNVCREPQTARKLLDSFNGFDWLLHAVDIEHLVTVHAGDEMVSCHGTFILKDGQHLEGTMTFRLNVAGDPIAEWKQGGWQPPIRPSAPTIPASLSRSSPSLSSPSPFRDGVADRQAWEAWVNWLNDDEKAGALYWASQRSLSHPGNCAALGGAQTIGCQEAQTRMSPLDARRKTEPDYRAGWNSIP